MTGLSEGAFGAIDPCVFPERAERWEEKERRGREMGGEGEERERDGKRGEGERWEERERDGRRRRRVLAQTPADGDSTTV